MTGEPLSDRDLFDAWCEGDRKAGHALFSRHFASIRRFFANKVDDDVEELVQRTFTACIEGRERFSRRSSFRTYLFGIARNKLREHFRSRHRGATPLDDVSVVDMGAGVSTVITERREQRLLLEALRRIPLEHQMLLELYFWENLSASEIGEIFDAPENTVRSRIRRGKQLVGEQLASLTSSARELESTLGNLEGWAESLRLRVAR